MQRKKQGVPNIVHHVACFLGKSFVDDTCFDDVTGVFYCLGTDFLLQMTLNDVNDMGKWEIV